MAFTKNILFFYSDCTFVRSKGLNSQFSASWKVITWMNIVQVGKSPEAMAL